MLNRHNLGVLISGSRHCYSIITVTGGWGECSIDFMGNPHVSKLL